MVVRLLDVSILVHFSTSSPLYFLRVPHWKWITLRYAFILLCSIAHGVLHVRGLSGGGHAHAPTMLFR